MSQHVRMDGGGQVRSMAAWRGQLVITTSALVPAMVSALLAGASKLLLRVTSSLVLISCWSPQHDVTNVH